MNLLRHLRRWLFGESFEEIYARIGAELEPLAWTAPDGKRYVTWDREQAMRDRDRDVRRILGG